MLRYRICPRCGAKTSSQTFYFCHACGARLDSLPTKRSPVSGPKVSPVAPPDHSHVIPAHQGRAGRVLLGVVGFIVLLGAIFAGSWWFFKGQQGWDRVPSGTAILGNQQPTTLTFPVSNYSLGSREFTALVPNGATFYLEGQSLDQMLDWLGGESLQASLSAVTDYSLGELASYLEPEMALVERQQEVALVAKVRSPGFWQVLVSQIILPDPWQTQLQGTTLVITNSSSLAGDIDRASRKLTISLALDSSFNKIARRLPSEGQFRFFILDKDARDSSLFGKLVVLADGLEGRGFVVREDEGVTMIVGER